MGHARFSRRLAVAAAGLASLASVATADARQLIGYDSARNRLVAFDSTAPGVRTVEFNVDDGPGNGFADIDVRPATGVIYGLGFDGVLYTIGRTGRALSVGAVIPAVSGAAGIDFDPVADRLRVVTNTGQNLRVNPATAAAVADTPLAYAAGDPLEGVVPGVTGAAYTNNGPGAVTTTLYDIDADADVLARQDPPDSGQLFTVGALGAGFSPRGGFDVTPAPEAAYALLGFDNVLAQVDLATGAATPIGQVPGQLTGITAPRPGEELTPCTVIGTPGDDILSGSQGPDTICGLGGNDRLNGGRGRDLLIGGPGNDSLFGQQDPDELRGEQGNDRLLGEGTVDNVFDDLLLGGDGNDQLEGGLGRDSLFGGDGDDRLLGQDGSDSLLGGDDEDTIEGGEAPDRASGEDGDDFVRGGLRNDDVSGGRGTDLVDGGDHTDSVNGDEGDDRVFGGGGADGVAGGPGRDAIDAGVGDDSVSSLDFPDPAVRDAISCGPGNDVLDRDATDPDPGNCHP